MKAAVLRDVGDMAITHVPDPTPGAGEVVIRVSHCGICGSDLHFWDTGSLGENMVLGHEFSGTIAALGPGTTGWRFGQRVSVAAGSPCGACVYCRDGDFQLCDAGSGVGTGGAPGGYAEYVRVSVDAPIPLADHVTLQQAATIEPLANGLHCVRKSAFRPGDGACVVGAGPIGLSVIAWLRRLGAGKIVVSEPAEGRRAVAKAMGADLVVDPRATDLGDVLAAEFHGVGPHVVYECVGRPETIQDAVFQVRKGGEVIIMGLCFEPATINPLAFVLRETRMRACLGTTKPEMEHTLAALTDGSLNTEGFVSAEIALAEVPDMFGRLHAPNSEVKVLIDHGR